MVTRENVDEVPDLLRFAQENRVTVYFSTMFEYFDAQDTVRDVRRTARKLKLVEQNGEPVAGSCGPAPAEAPGPDDGSLPDLLLGLLYAPFPLINLHFRKHVETQDPSAPTQCYANKRILTVGPDGRLVLPCHHAFDNSVVWDRDLAELVRDEEFQRVRDEELAGYASLLPAEAAEPLLGVPTGPPRPSGSSARALDRLLDDAPAADAPSVAALIEAVRALRTEVPGEELAGLLLARELREPALMRRRGEALRRTEVRSETPYALSRG